jgi:hypothetical protein
MRPLRTRQPVTYEEIDDDAVEESAPFKENIMKFAFKGKENVMNDRNPPPRYAGFAQPLYSLCC